MLRSLIRIVAECSAFRDSNVRERNQNFKNKFMCHNFEEHFKNISTNVLQVIS